MWVCTYVQFKCTELADSSCFSPSSLLNAVQPWRNLRSKHPGVEGGQLSAFLFKPGETKSPGPRCRSLGAETPLCLRYKHVPVPQSGQFVLASPATKSPTEIKRLCPCLETEGQNSLTVHDSDWPQPVLISHSWGFLKKGLRVSKPQTMWGPASIRLEDYSSCLGPGA